MAEGKKRKVDSECRKFHEKWTNSYFFVQKDKKPLCLICKETVAVFKAHNIKRHYDSKHKTTYDQYVGVCREQKIAKLRKEVDGLTKMFNRKRKENESAVRASFRVAHILSKEAKPFSEGECVKKCILAVVEELCPEKKNVIEAVSLSRMTITRRVEDLGGDLMQQLKTRAGQFEMFSIAVDESTDVSDTAQLLVFIRGINCTFEVIEELAAMKSMNGTTTGEDLFREVSEVIQELSLDWSKLIGVTTDGARSMVGRHSGLVARIRHKVIECNGSPPLELHCIIHQQNLCGKQLNLEHVMKVVVKCVNFIRSHALNHRTFREFLIEVESEHEDVVYHSEVRWLSRGKVLKRFFDLRHEISSFMAGKAKQVPEISDPSWLWDLAILCDLTAYLNELNLKLQGKNKLICHVYADINAFQAKLKLFIQQAAREQLLHFPTCAELHQEDMDVPFPKGRMVQLLKLLSENFEQRFADFHSMKNNIRLFENPFAVDTSTAPADLQLELIDLQSQTSQLDKFREKALPCFYAELCPETFPTLRKLGQRMMTTFASTYVCEQTFSVLKRAKPVSRARLTDDHLHSVLRINVTNLEPNISKLVSAKNLQTSH